MTLRNLIIFAAVGTGISNIFTDDSITTLNDELQQFTDDHHELLDSELKDLNVVKVTRCKDCIYSHHWYGDRGICYLWNDETGNSVFDLGFCYYGTRAEVDHDTI